MARTYGFRVYRMKAYPNRISGNEPFDAHHDGGIPNRILETLEVIADAGTHFFTPRPPKAPKAGEAAEPAKSPTSISVHRVEKVNDNLIIAVVAQGEKDSHSSAKHETKKKVKNLKNYSAEAEHFVSFHFPTIEDPTFYMVSQTRLRKDVAENLVRRLVLASREIREARIAADRANREAIKAAGEKPPRRQNFDRLAFDRKQATDDAYIEEILGSAKSISTTFTASAPAGRGATEGQVEKVLTIKMKTVGGLQRMQKLGRLWSTEEETTRSHSDAVGEAADELQEEGIVSDGELIGYDKSRINVRGATGDSTTIAVDTVRDVFTYPVSDGKPGPEFFFTRVRERLSKIALQEFVEIDDFDPAEVAECLEDSA